MSDSEKQILAALDAYQSAVLTKNVDAFMQLYAPDVRVFDTWGVWSHEGAVAWRVAIESWFGSLGSETVRVSFDAVNVIATPTFASMSAFARYAAFSAEGEELRSMQNRMTWVLKAHNHALRIVHEHTSVPIGLEDTKAIFHREG